MPTVIITDLSPAELFARATKDARHASLEIDRLLYSNFEPGESREDRALKVAAQARVLSEAWMIVDSLANGETPISAADIAKVCSCDECRTKQPPQRDNANTN
jgi:hypothetical protein